MKRVVIGALVAAVAIFFWGFIYWNILPFNFDFQAPVDNEAGLAQSLKDHLPESGNYFLPHPSKLADPADTGPYETGPVARITFMRDGIVPYAPTMFIGGFLHMFLAVLIMGLVLRSVIACAPTSMSKVKIVALAGLAGAFFAHIDDPIWYHYPWDMHLLYFFYDVTSWIIAGFILARFVRSEDAS